MVLLIEDQYIPVDVKVEQIDYRDKNWYSRAGVHKDVYLVLVNPESLKIRWKNKKGGGGNKWKPNCPPGLEDFWS